MTWQILDTGKNNAQKNMMMDAEFLRTIADRPILHLYDWEKEAATYGHFIKPEIFFNLANVQSMNFDLAQRPTGGGIVFHVADYAFSLLVPSSHQYFSSNPLDNYHFVNERVAQVIYLFFGEKVDLLPSDNKSERGDFCMAKPTKYDLMLNGKKVGGAAQRKTKLGFLHQGSIFLGHLAQDFLENILQDSAIISLMHSKSAPLLGSNWTKNQLNEARHQLKEIFTKVFS